MIEHDNPAARLHDFLTRAKSIGKSENLSVQNALERLHGTTAPMLLIRRQGELLALIGDTLNALDELADRGLAASKHWPTKVFQAFGSVTLTEPFKTLQQQIDEHTLYYLEMASHLLEAHRKSKKIDANELQSLKNSLSELLEEVLTSKEDLELKKYLSRALRRILTAIEEYQLIGPQGLLYEIDAIVGAAVRNPEVKKNQGNALFEKVFTGIAAVANTMTIATGTLQLAGTTAKALGLGP